jgi:hypothetical protein
MCRKVRGAVANVERNRVKYSHIDDRELQSRKSFCDRLDAQVLQMKSEYSSRETQGKLEADQRRELTSRMQTERETSARNQNSYTRGNADYMKDQSQAQATIRREQDVSLDKMSTGLDTLREMAVAIDAELKDQEKIIDDVDKSVDEAQVRRRGSVWFGGERAAQVRGSCGARRRRAHKARGRLEADPRRRRSSSPQHLLTFPPHPTPLYVLLSSSCRARWTRP